MLQLAITCLVIARYRGHIGLWRNRRFVRGSGEDLVRRFPGVCGAVVLRRRDAPTMVGLTRVHWPTGALTLACADSLHATGAVER